MSMGGGTPGGTQWIDWRKLSVTAELCDSSPLHRFAPRPACLATAAASNLALADSAVRGALVSVPYHGYCRSNTPAVAGPEAIATA
jgi:hypothetical protein